MRVVGVATVRNEADVIEAFVRHHAGVLDRLLVVCHFSQDSTGGILAALVEEGLPLDVGVEPRPVHDQAALMTALAHRAVAEHEADVVVALDADEFLVATDGDPRAALAELPTETISLVRWRTYVPLESDPADERNVLRRITHRPEREHHPLGKVILPRATVRRGVAIQIGNHQVQDVRTRRPLATVDAIGLALAHFPFRSDEQVRTKLLGGWPVHLANPKRWGDQSGHWRDNYEQALGAGFDAPLLVRKARGYAFAHDEALVHDPVEAPFELRYPGEQADPVQVLGATAVALAEELRRATVEPPSFAWRLRATLRRRLRS